MPSIQTNLEQPTPPAPQAAENQTPQLPSSPTVYSPRRPHASHGSTGTPSSAVSGPISSISPSARHPLSRPLSPDLPVRDALYVFSNFASYMRSPHEGADGIHSSTDFRDTLRLLDYARSLASHQSNVHILHVKYRFQGPGSRGSSGVYPPPGQLRDAGKARKPIPQPFSTLHDPVVKLDYKENGTFEPLPAQAIYAHIAKCCQPPPRVIVYSYVGSQVTQNHLSSLSTWALASSPPAYVFSPLETRIREKETLHQALHYAIPMSMYAWAAESSPLPNRQSSAPQHPLVPSGQAQVTRRRRLSAPSESIPLDLVDISNSPEKMYPPDPVASLTVTAESSSASSVPPPMDRIPLWALVPGVGALQGSTSASIGVKLSDFFAIKIAGESEARDRTDAERKRRVSQVYPGLKPLGTLTPTEPAPKTLLREVHDLKAVPPVEAPARPITPSRALTPKMHPGQRALVRVQLVASKDTEPSTLASAGRTLSSSSWPGPVSRVPGWKRGRKEQMEDILESLGLCGDDGEVGSVTTQVGKLDLTTKPGRTGQSVAA